MSQEIRRKSAARRRRRSFVMSQLHHYEQRSDEATSVEDALKRSERPLNEVASSLRSSQ